MARIGVLAGLAGGADAVLIPEAPTDLDELCARLQGRHARGHRCSIVVVAERAQLAGDPAQDRTAPAVAVRTTLIPSGGGLRLEHEIARGTGYDTRATILGQIVLGGTPCASCAAGRPAPRARRDALRRRPDPRDALWHRRL